MMNMQVTGLVLAGGQSRRMGQNKADMIWRGKSLLQHASDLLIEAGCGQVLISGAEDMPDRFTGLGPLAGLEAACAKLGPGQVFLGIPVDMPQLQISLLENLMNAWQPESKGVHFQRHPLPCILKNTAHLRTYLRQTLQDETADRSMFCMFGRLGIPALEVPHDSAQSFFNCNTPKDMQVLEGRS